MRSSRSEADPLDPGPLGFAHRGLHGPGVPENSLAAFEAAIKLGAGFECDVRLAGDGSAVVFHDRDLERMCNVRMEVDRTPAALLTGQRLSDTDQYIPALRQLLELAAGRVPMLLELKTCNGNAQLICREVVSDLTPRAGAIGVMSFDPMVGHWLRRNAPQIRRGLVLDAGVPTLRRWISLLVARPQFLAVDRTTLGKSWVKRARRRMPIYSWTIRTAKERAQAEVQADALIWEGNGRPRN